jgi:uncharacterized membrane protein YgdD (TMEM256/DUF423 family)
VTHPVPRRASRSRPSAAVVSVALVGLLVVACGLFAAYACDRAAHDDDTSNRLTSVTAPRIPRPISTTHARAISCARLAACQERRASCSN